MATQEEMRNDRIRAAAVWTEFAARNGLEILRHGHGSLFAAAGKLEGMDVTVAEHPDGLEVAVAGVLPSDVEFVICDRAYLDWSRESARIRAREKTARIVSKNLRGRAESELTPFAVASTLPHRATSLEPTTGDADFDERFRLLHRGAVLVASASRVYALKRLQSPVTLEGYRGLLRLVFTRDRPGEDVLKSSLTVARVLREGVQQTV